jgi:hypothetical protein
MTSTRHEAAIYWAVGIGRTQSRTDALLLVHCSCALHAAHARRRLPPRDARLLVASLV